MPKWDESPDGRANSSAAFFEIRETVTRIIRAEAASLIAGRADNVAHCIVAGLAHGPFQMGPHQPELLEACDRMLNENPPFRVGFAHTDLCNQVDNCGCAVSKARAALAKAKGEKPDAR